LVITFTGGSKIYDSYRNAGSTILGTISGTIGLEQISISGFSAMFKDQNAGLRFIDISNIILAGPTVNNYFILPVVSITGIISQKSLVATFTGGNKIYDKTQVTGIVLSSISGVVNKDIIYVGYFTTLFQNYLAGPQFIDISNITLSGILPSNYYLLPINGLLEATIYQRPLTIIFSNGQKTFDGTTVPGYLFEGTISNRIITDNVILSNNYFAKFKSPNAGPQFIDISNIKIVGSDIKNYYILPVPPFSSYINKRNLKAIFSGGEKIYDGTNRVYLLNYVINGTIDSEFISISSYDATFLNPNVGEVSIDISNVILYGVSNNYVVQNISRITSYIFRKNLYLIFTGGDKIYDSTLIPGNTLVGTLSGLVNNEIINITTFSSAFVLGDIGLQQILITNPILIDTKLVNYQIQPMQNTYATISPRISFINFTGGDKIYDGTLIPGKINSLLYNNIPTDYLPVNIGSALYNNSNAGTNTITLRNVTIDSKYASNYQFIIQQTMSGVIATKMIQAVFKGGDKVYDKQYNTGSISGYLVNVLPTDNVIINEFTSIFRNNIAGLQIIDISNIKLGGSSALNYYLNSVFPINANIFKSPINAIFTASDKIYDKTNIPNNLNYILTPLFTNDQVYLINYVGVYSNINVGNRIINITNAILAGDNSINYQLNSINPIFVNIVQRSLTINFYGGNKIYDTTTNTANIFYTISNAIQGDYVIVNSFTSRFRNPNAGIQIIDVSNVIIFNIESNYNYNPVFPFSSIIFQKPINILFSNLNKIYDGTQNINFNFINYNINGLLGSDNLTISSFSGLYKDYLVGKTLLDISNIILYGQTRDNYTINPIPSQLAFINLRLLTIVFSGGNKTYNGLYDTGPINYSFLNIVQNDSIVVFSFNSKYKDYNIGNQIIDISNITISGLRITNYYLVNQPPITGRINPMSVLVTFTGVNKTYDNTNLAYVINPVFTGLILNDVNNISISSYNSYYADKFVQVNKTIYVDKIILTGYNSNNYIVNPSTILSSSTILPLQIYLISIGVTKIYDQKTNATLSNIYLSGYFSNDHEFLSISSFVANYSDINVQYNKLINITNIVLTGPYAFNYFINSTTTVGNILKLTIPISFTGVNKNFDGTILASVINITISNIIYPDNVYVTTYNSNFTDADVGVNKTIIIYDISFGGTARNNYTTGSSYTSANITYPISLTLSLTSNNIVYNDISNYAQILVNPSWIIKPFNTFNLLTGIYQNIIISSNGTIFNLINNNLTTIYTSNYSFTNLVMTDINNGFICGLSGLIISTSNSFNTINVSTLGNNLLNSVSQINTGVAFLVGNNGIIYKTLDSGTTWTLTRSPTSLNLNDVSIINSNLALIVGNNGILLQTTNGGLSWTQKTISTVNLYSIVMIDQYNGYIVGANGTILKTNDGSTWSSIVDSNNNKYTTHDLNNIYVLNSIDVMVVGNNGTILRSTNRGTTWFSYISGTLLKLTKIFMNTFNDIIIIGDKGLILVYNQNPGGNIQLYNNNNLITEKYLPNNNSFYNYYFNQLNVNNYYLNATFIPDQLLNFGTTNTSIQRLIVKPILYYPISTFYILYDRPNITYSIQPIIDQSGGLFTIIDYLGSIVQQSLVVINNITGVIQFQRNININLYIFTVIYSLNNTSNQVQYTLIVQPNIYYYNNLTSLIYNNSGVSSIPYYVQTNGVFVISDISGKLVSNNLVTINQINGIISFSNLCPINNYTFLITYTLNNISNTTQYFLNIKPFINYSPNVTNLQYLSYANSLLPILNLPGGNFVINDLNSNLVSLNSVRITSSGIINFDNNITFGNYSFTVIYTFNNIQNSTIYHLNASPYVLYPETYRVIQFDHTIFDASSSPIYIPSGGLFSAIDISGSLIQQKLVTINSDNGQLIFNNINVNSYIFRITYLYNFATSITNYTLQIKPTIYYTINQTLVVNGNTANSLAPYVNPPNGTFNIVSTENLLIQLNLVNINYLNGVINFLPSIPIGIFNFQTNYTFNNITSSTNYILQTVPFLNYSINNLSLLYDTSAISIQPIYFPIDGIFTISGIYDSTKIRINNVGILSFSNSINVGIYNLVIFYSINNCSNFYNYNLTVQPIIIYPTASTTLIYKRSITNISIIPLLFQSGGTFVIVDNSSNFINLVPNYVFIDTSGIIYFNPNISVALYSFTIYYTLNNVTNYTYYNLTIKPNISYSISNVTLLYDRLNNYFTEDALVDQSGGVFSINVNYATINNLGSITLYPLLNVGLYTITTKYILRNSFNITAYNVTIQPNIYYTISSAIINYGISYTSIGPYYIQQGGTFTITDISNSKIAILNLASINQLGIIKFNNNISVGIYYFLITYSLNNVTNSTIFNYNVIPNLNYSVNKIVLLYDQSGNSVNPTFSEKNGYFSIFDVSSNGVASNNVIVDSQTGVIYFNNTFNVGIYFFNIIYSLNYISNNVYYLLNVLPTIYYSDYNNVLLYDRIIPSYSTNPIYKQPNGLFSIVDNLGNLVQNNMVFINPNTGIITFKIQIDVGLYSFTIIYSLNNLYNTFTYNLTIIPNLIYTPARSIINYNRSGISMIPYYNQINGSFTIDDVIGNLISTDIISINNINGQIQIPKAINVGKYQFKVKYTLNGTFNTYYYDLYIIPNINYLIFTKNMNYGNSSQSVLPIVTQTKGNFYILDFSNNAVHQNAVSINSITGLITFTDYINVGIYVLNIEYKLNNVSNYFKYYLNVYPVFDYSPNPLSILYNRASITDSSPPNVKQPGGSFILYDISGYSLIASEMVYVDTSGIIYFKKNIIVGIYKFNIIYFLNGLSTQTNYNLIIIPNITYNSSVNTLLYGDLFYSGLPYFDQSGGIFTFSDVSGLLVSSDIISYDISGGKFSIVKIPDVGLYNFIVRYFLNNVSNYINIIFYILPIITYNINSAKYIYSLDNFSIEPTVIQQGGVFSFTGIGNYENILDGISINPLTGIIQSSSLTNIDFYTLTIIYTLNSVVNTTKYYLEIFGLYNYSIKKLQTPYKTSAQSGVAIFDPSGGLFKASISGELININQDNGMIFFSNKFNPGIYNIKMYYVYNNVPIPLNFTYIMEPLLRYLPSYLEIPYNTISNSVLPDVDPINGVFTASVPSINLIYTGISINSRTGVLRFGKISGGIWPITVKYTVNGITTTTNYELTVVSYIQYKPQILFISNNTIVSTSQPFSLVKNGEWSSTATFAGFSINSITGILTFTQMVTGFYEIPINYSVFGVDYSITYTLIVLASLTYNPDNVSIFYTESSQFSIPQVYPPGGIFSANFNDDDLSPLISMIYIDSISGFFRTISSLVVGKYNLLSNYLINESTKSVPFTINVYPNFNYFIGSSTIIYDTLSKSEKPIINPSGGIFTTKTIFFVNETSGIIEFKNTTNVGVYIIPVTYTYNEMEITKNYNLTVKPLYYYSINSIDIVINTGGQSKLPIAKQSLGIFNFVSVSGTITIPYALSFLTNNNRYIDNGIILNAYNGIINFGKSILVGYYNFVLSYTLYNLVSTTNYSIIVRPYINYAFSDLILDYNTSAFSSTPVVDQSGGFFYFSNTTNLNSEFNKITINNYTGVINFNNGIKVGVFKINITYIISQVSNTTVYTLTIKPIYYYSNPVSIIIVNTIGYSEEPVVIQAGGFFSVYDYGNLSTDNVVIDSTTGIIKFIDILIGRYDFVFNYTLNGSSISTNYQLIVAPYLSYDINRLNLFYTREGYSQIPYVPFPGGSFGLEDITELTIMKSKISIDISNGQLYFAKYINTGFYNIMTNYIYNGIKTIYPYNLNVTPLFEYTISGVVLDYNHKPYKSNIPNVNPTKGLYFFSDNSNNYPIKEIILNKNTGIITINKLMVGSYNLGIKYYLKQYVSPNRYIVTILPTFYYSISHTTFSYTNGYEYSVVPTSDPSGGIFKIIYPVDQNLVYNISIDSKTGLIRFNKLIEINNYSFLLSYTYNNINTFFTYKLLVQSLFNYNEQTLRLLNENSGNSSIPNVYPYNGIFTINYINITNQNYKATVSSLSGIIIDPYVGQIIFSNYLNIGSYLINLSYTYLDIPTQFNYLLQVLSNLSYDVSGETIIYGMNNNYSYRPSSDIQFGLYEIDRLYNNYGIFIDQSSGILNFSSIISVNYYPINISYTILDIKENFIYNLLVVPNIYYDISYININYNEIFKTNKPFINPIGGSFITNYGIIDSSGILIINNLDVSNYIINIKYKVNNIFNNYLLMLKIYPIFYYSNISVNIASKNNRSYPPFFSPNNGKFYLDISNISIQNNGVIQFDPNEPIGKYLLPVHYIINNIIKSTTYTYIVIPYINYSIPNISVVRGITSNSCTPLVKPLNGKFICTFPIDSSGIIYFNSNLKVGLYNINVNYGFNDLSNNFIYNLTITPYIFYNNAIIQYGTSFKSEIPINNSYGGQFYLTYDLFSLINITAISIDISSGIINFKPTLSVGSYFFYVNYLVNTLVYTHTYNILINPTVIYSNFNVNQFNIFNNTPTIINPPGGIFSSTNLPSFIILDSKTGRISSNNANIVGSYNLVINYNFNDTIILTIVQVNVNPTIYYSSSFLITYLDRGYSNSPIVSISGGLYFGINVPSGLVINKYTGVFNYNDVINVNNYTIQVVYIINDVSGFTNFNLTVAPYLNYSSSTLLNYGTVGTSIQPNTNPQGGIFSLINPFPDITIDPTYGIITYGSTNKVNTYLIYVKYTYNKVNTIFTTNLVINPKVLSVNFEASDKVFDGNTSVIFISNKMIGTINDDKVFITTYNSAFQRIGPGKKIPVFVYNLILGGSDSYNYTIQYDNLATGNIYLAKYSPNSIKSNQGTAYYSSPPIVSSILTNPFFIIPSITISGNISGVISGITVSPFGIINWNNSLPIAIYYITIRVYNTTFTQDVEYILEITTNLFTGTLDIVPPSIPNVTVQSSVYQLKYNAPTGNAYVLDNKIDGLLGKFSITAYSKNNNNISHDLGASYPFIFQLENADPSANLFSYEINDDGSVNYSVGYKLSYLGGKSYAAYLTYLSDFYIQNISVLVNTPPVFIPPSGSYDTSAPLLVNITALPNSIIYYTIDGSDPSFTSPIYISPLQFSFGNITLKSFAFTPGRETSSITTGTYTISQVPCLLSKTLIRTPYGNELIDNLKEGDLIVTDDNRIVPIVQILKYKIESPNESSYPVCIPKDYFSIDIPDRNTYISQNHAIKLTDEYWIYGRHHLKYFNKYLVKPLYYHILLPNYFKDNLIANNMTVESWSGLLPKNSLVSYKNQTLVKFKDNEYIAFKKYIMTSNLIYKNYKT